MQTAFIDLQKRLQHLTTFSSGLILLSGKGASRQQGFLSDFLSEFDESVNIACINASDTKDDTSFRQQMLTQLFATRSLDVRRPLPQSIPSAALNEGRIMIAVSHAGELTPIIIQELWELSQRDGHVCIVLAGETPWALETKQHLSGKAQPVLLQYDFPESTELALSDLDKLIAQKREAFNARLAQRHQSMQRSESSLGLIGSKVFRVIIVMVFMVSFGGLIHWFHPEVLNGLLAGNAIADVQLQDNHEQDTPPVTESPESQGVKTAAYETPSAVKSGSPVEPVPEPEVAAAVTASKNTPDETVTQWSEAVKTLPNASVGEQASEPGTQSVSSAPEEDSTEPQIDNEAKTAVQTEPPGSVQPQQPDYQWDEQRLLTLPDSDYLLQLSAASSQQVLDEFIQRHGLDQMSWRYQTQRYGGNWHVLLMQGSFSNLEQAKAAVNQLPEPVRAEQPFAKRVAQIRKEISSHER